MHVHFHPAPRPLPCENRLQAGRPSAQLPGEVTVKPKLRAGHRRPARLRAPQHTLSLPPTRRPQGAPPTCQAAVHAVVLLPKPENRLVRGPHRVHGLGGQALKVLPTLLTAEEGADVPPDGLQHGLGVTSESCGGNERPVSTTATGPGGVTHTGPGRAACPVDPGARSACRTPARRGRPVSSRSTHSRSHPEDAPASQPPSL